MIKVGTERILLQGGARLEEQSAPIPRVLPNTLLVYSKDVAGVTTYWYKDDAQVEHQIADVASIITDHGGLTGLADDDHPQYVLHTEVDDVPVNGATTDPISSNWAFDHEAAADPHIGYRLESADHTHQSAGLQAGQLDHGLALTGLGDDDHTQYVLRSILTTNGDLFTRAAGVIARIGIGTAGQVLTVVSGAPAWETLPASGDSGGGSGHVHGLARLVAPGIVTTFELPDIAEYIDSVIDDGVVIDPAVYTLSANATQLVFDAAPVAASVLQVNYVIAGL